jgi:hypothetical protein
MNEFELVTVQVPRFFLDDLEMMAWRETDYYREYGLINKYEAVEKLAIQVADMQEQNA